MAVKTAKKAVRRRREKKNIRVMRFLGLVPANSVSEVQESLLHLLLSQQQKQQQRLLWSTVLNL